MGKRHEKGLIWILMIIMICVFFMYLLKDYSPNSGLVENITNSNVDMIDNGISLRDVGGENFLAEEQEELWILFDQLIFEREESPVKTFLFSGVLILYVICIGPGVYFFLKKKEKMEWLWILLPVAAITFSGMILLMGEGFAVRSPEIDSLTVISPGKQDVVYVTSTSPGRDAYSLEFEDAVASVTPLYVGGEYDLYNGNVIQNDSLYRIEEEASTLSLNLEPREAFSKDYIRLQLDHGHKGRVKCELSMEDGVPVGILKNDTSWDFSDVMLFYGDRYVRVTNFDSQKEITVAQEDWKNVNEAWTGQGRKRPGSNRDSERILTLGYLKYYEWENEPGDLQITAVIEKYQSSISNDGDDTISRGLFYQWEYLE